MYKERLRVPAWFHLAGLGFVVLFGSDLAASFQSHPAVQLSGYATIFVVIELLLWRVGSGLVRIADGQLRAGDWQLPLSKINTAAQLDATDLRAAQQIRDGQTYRFTRGWVHSAVRLDVDDPDDLPVWLVSTRRPGALAAAILTGRDVSVAALSSQPDGCSPTADPR